MKVVFALSSGLWIVRVLEDERAQHWLGSFYYTRKGTYEAVRDILTYKRKGNDDQCK